MNAPEATWRVDEPIASSQAEVQKNSATMTTAPFGFGGFETVKAARASKSFSTEQVLCARLAHETGHSTSRPTSNEQPSTQSQDASRSVMRGAIRAKFAPNERALIRERNGLVRKQFANHLSAKETTRLKYVNWQLDQIDDALHGEHLDKLEQMAELHERLAGKVQHFYSQLCEVLPAQRRRPRR